MADFYYCRFCPRMERCWWVWDNLGGCLCEMPISSVSLKGQRSKCSGHCDDAKDEREKK
ncbi:MAG: hypothetical protein V1736_09390 [Pseudomonadota bacterium]